MLTTSVIVAAYRCPLTRAQAWLPHLQLACALAEITTEYRLAHFVAQIGHESGRLRHTRELWGPTAQQQRYEPPSDLARRLGNVRPGDGARYRGRGLIQTTGRANYLLTTRRLRELLGESVPDFVVAPALLEQPLWAALSAAVYWRERGLNRWADAQDLITLTRRVNGGLTGLADRQAIYTAALGALVH